jgi:hypothetical protein
MTVVEYLFIAAATDIVIPEVRRREKGSFLELDAPVVERLKGSPERLFREAGLSQAYFAGEQLVLRQ